MSKNITGYVHKYISVRLRLHSQPLLIVNRCLYPSVASSLSTARVRDRCVRRVREHDDSGTTVAFRLNLPLPYVSVNRYPMSQLTYTSYHN